MKTPRSELYRLEPRQMHLLNILRDLAFQRGDAPGIKVSVRQLSFLAHMRRETVRSVLAFLASDKLIRGHLGGQRKTAEIVVQDLEKAWKWPEMKRQLQLITWPQCERLAKKLAQRGSSQGFENRLAPKQASCALTGPGTGQSLAPKPASQKARIVDLKPARTAN